MMNVHYQSYAEYRSHPVYQAIRQVVKQRDKDTCVVCGAPATETHHDKYPPWDTFDVPANMRRLCHKCHCKQHGKES